MNMVVVWLILMVVCNNEQYNDNILVAIDIGFGWAGTRCICTGSAHFATSYEFGLAINCY